MFFVSKSIFALRCSRVPQVPAFLREDSPFCCYSQPASSLSITPFQVFCANFSRFYDKTENPQNPRIHAGFGLVLVARLELARCCHRGILSPLRLPIPPHQHANRQIGGSTFAIIA
jgi:hypothetical protein